MNERVESYHVKRWPSLVSGFALFQIIYTHQERGQFPMGAKRNLTNGIRITLPTERVGPSPQKLIVTCQELQLHES